MATTNKFKAMLTVIYDNFVHTYCDKKTRGLALMNLSNELGEISDEQAHSLIYTHANHFMTKYRKAYFFQKINAYIESRSDFINDLNHIYPEE